METLPDIDLLFRKLITESDENAFQALFYQFFPSLCAFAHRYIKNPDVCEDIVQESFFKIWEKRKSIQIECSARNFLLTTVKNHCIDYLRRKELDERWKLWHIENAEEENCRDIYSVTELRQLISNALEKMSSEVRQAFVWSRFLGKKHSEIAEMQHVKLRTVEARIGKALSLLREELKDYLPISLISLLIF